MVVNTMRWMTQEYIKLSYDILTASEDLVYLCNDPAGKLKVILAKMLLHHGELYHNLIVVCKQEQQK
jgi:hypothetical protein